MKRIVIKVHLETDKSKEKALKIAAEAQGVQGILLEGNEVVVIGEVDAVGLTNKMRKKLRYATLLRVEDVRDSDEEDEEGGEERDESTSMENGLPLCPICARIHIQPVIMYPHDVVYEPYPNGCSIV